jgi:hypothetical protein
VADDGPKPPLDPLSLTSHGSAVGLDGVLMLSASVVIGPSNRVVVAPSTHRLTVIGVAPAGATEAEQAATNVSPPARARRLSDDLDMRHPSWT